MAVRVMYGKKRYKNNINSNIDDKDTRIFSRVFSYTEKRQVQGSWEEERYVELFKENKGIK